MDNKIIYLDLIEQLKDEYGNLTIDKIKENIIKQLSCRPEDISFRLNGLSKEKEFLLMLVLFLEQKTDQITYLADQKNYINKEEYIIPDFLVSINNTPILIDVKTFSKKERAIISKYNFDKLKKYSELYNLPLYFAINVTNLWFFIDSKDFTEIVSQKINGKKQEAYTFTIDQLFKNNKNIFKNYIWIKEGTIICKKYSKETTGIKFEEDYYLLEHNILYKNLSKCYLIDGKLESYVGHFVLKHLARGETEEIRENETIVFNYVSDSNYFIPLLNLVLKCYLYFRRNLQKPLNEKGTSINFYLNHFSSIDYYILHLIKTVIQNLEKQEIIGFLITEEIKLKG